MELSCHFSLLQDIATSSLLFNLCTVAIERLLHPRPTTGIYQQLVFTMSLKVPKAMGIMCLYVFFLELIFYQLMCLARPVHNQPWNSVSTLDHNHYKNPYSSYKNFSEMKGLKLMTVNARSIKGKIKQFRSVRAT